MERKKPKPMTPLDNMVTPPHLYTLKLLLPYTPSSNQRFMAIYIKFMELQYTMEHFNGFSRHQSHKDFGQSAAPFGMFEDLKPYMAEEETAMMEQMEMMMNMMEMMQSMPTSDGTSNSSGGNGSINPMDMMMGMLNPEQQDMFQTYSNMFDADVSQMSDSSEGESTVNSKEKGAEQHGYESMDESSRNAEY